MGTYYQQMKLLAQEKRQLHEIETSKLNLNVIRAIYKKEGITIDSWDLKGRKLKACYCADGEPSVLVNKNLPREPRLFALAHELKHHYVDREQILGGQHKCGDYNEGDEIEIGAEVFAAQFIYPEGEMHDDLARFGVTKLGCTAETIVRFKKDCPAIISYTFLLKRFTRFGFIEKGEFSKVQFVKLEEKVFGPPLHKQDWFKQYRKRKSQD
jgi:Zn-dependent peptidase ImmA (M78 family)